MKIILTFCVVLMIKADNPARNPTQEIIFDFIKTGVTGEDTEKEFDNGKISVVTTGEEKVFKFFIKAKEHS